MGGNLGVYKYTYLYVSLYTPRFVGGNLGVYKYTYICICFFIMNVTEGERDINKMKFVKVLNLGMLRRKSRLEHTWKICLF